MRILDYNRVVRDLILGPAVTPVVTRDLADVLELVVGNLDVQSIVPDPVVDDPPTFTLSVSNARVAESSAPRAAAAR